MYYFRDTKHGNVRLRQRGFHFGDRKIFFLYGTFIDDSRVVLLKSDIRDALICGENPQQIDRLKVRELVVKEGKIVTGYVRHRAYKGRVRRRKTDERKQQTHHSRSGRGRRGTRWH